MFQALHFRRLSWALSIAGAFALAGCKAQPCNTVDPNSPSSSLECPAGDLCYLGECVKSCSAGQERAAACTSNGDCEAARPNCIAGFCSSCDDNETCVPTLNICTAVDDVLYPPIALPEPNPSPVPSPLDAGAHLLDGGVVEFGGLQRLRDAGVVGPVEPGEVTVSGFFDIGEVVDYRTGNPNPAQTSTVSLNVFDVSGVGRGLKWRADLSPPRIEQTDIDLIFTLEPCIVRDVKTSTTRPNTGQVNLGNVTIDDLRVNEDAMNGTLLAQFVPGPDNYVVQRNDITAGPIQNFSSLTPFVTRWVEMASPGNDTYTAGGWPDFENGEFRGFHVPFQLEPSTTTQTLIEQDIVVSIAAPQDLTFTSRYVTSGNDNSERVIVRVIGQRTELFCFDIEGSNGRGRIDVPATVLSEYVRREGGQPQTNTLVFERASILSPRVDPAIGQLIAFTVRLRHSYLTNLRFVP